ncbi:MAG: glycoside hydrolase family 130 protein [Lysobacterales bacterium]
MTQSWFLRRQPVSLYPDPARVVVRPFRPANEPRNLNPVEKGRVEHIVDRVLLLDSETAEKTLKAILNDFEGRHRRLLTIFEERADEILASFEPCPAIPYFQRCLIGAYFLHEYSFEASALFNPSIVPDPDQANVPAGDCRFILSLRAVGEGHISSITFRSGTVTGDGQIRLERTTGHASTPDIQSHVVNDVGDEVEMVFNHGDSLCERVIFPVTGSQSNGIEDARFVRFENDTYYATYTAYSGREIRPELLETRDFKTFRLTPLGGGAAKNKGMALFPRKIDGRYAMIARHDNENLYLIYSDDLYHWDGGEPILRPAYPWESFQIGNCGSPIELDDCWLLLTHGVGAVRKYSIGAVLLDKDNPARIIARSKEPLIHPDPIEHEGYVPNVVYTCGAMRHGGHIILPYGVCDTFTNFAVIPITDLMRALTA